MTTVAVNQTDLWYMLLGYVRYAMGRVSTAPGLAQDLIRSYGPGCTTVQLDQIRREICDELATYERMGRLLGMGCDHETWKACVVDIDAQLAARPQPILLRT